jgi:hypothetical protein
MLLQIAIAVIVAYGGIVGVMYLAQRSLMYVPDIARASPIAAGLPQAEEWQASAWTRRWSSSGCVLLYPRYIPVHPPLEKLPACCADAAICLEQPILRLDKGLGLAKCRHIKICEDSAKMLLGNRGTDCTDRNADDARRFAGPGALAVGP